MHISTRMRDRWFGGYPFTKTCLFVAYSNRCTFDQELARAQWYRYFLERWGGTVAPDDLYVEASADPLIHKGELIQYAHAKLFSEKWVELRLSRGWPTSREWKDWFSGQVREQSRENGWAPEEVNIKIAQHDTYENRQQDSEIQLTREVAQWLGETLLEFAAGNIPSDQWRRSLFGPAKWLRTFYMTKAEQEAFEKAEQAEQEAREAQAAQEAERSAAEPIEPLHQARIIMFPVSRAMGTGPARHE